jgi:iron(III) transport system permease protein
MGEPKIKKLLSGSNKWSAAAVVLSLILLLPFASLIAEALGMFTGGAADGMVESGSHFLEHLFLDYLLDTILLLALTGGISLILAIPAAYILSSRDFQGRRLLYWLNILPLTIPTYIASYIWAEIFAYPNTGYWLLSDYLGITSIYSLFPLAMIFASVLYPYVFIQAYNAFTTSVLRYEMLSLSLGKGRAAFYMRSGARLLIYPVSFGLMLLMLETLNDYGAVKLYGINTLTSGIFKVWYGMGDMGSALVLSVSLLVAVAGLRFLVSRLRLQSATLDTRVSKHDKLSLSESVLPIIISGAVPFLAFIFPVIYMGFEILGLNDMYFDAGMYVESVWDSARFALMGAVLTVSISTVISYSRFHSKRKGDNRLGGLVSFAVSGYAVPGAVTALGAVFLGSYLGMGFLPPAFLMIWAYVSRYIFIAYSPIDTAMDNAYGKYSLVSMSLGKSMGRSLWKVVVPPAKLTLLTAGIMAGIEIMKDLPLTLILRDYGTDTLATSAYRYANDEQLVRSFPYGLSLVSLGMIAVYLSEKFGRTKH